MASNWPSERISVKMVYGMDSELSEDGQEVDDPLLHVNELEEIAELVCSAEVAFCLST